MELAGAPSGSDADAASSCPDAKDSQQDAQEDALSDPIRSAQPQDAAADSQRTPPSTPSATEPTPSSLLAEFLQETNLSEKFRAFMERNLPKSPEKPFGSTTRASSAASSRPWRGMRMRMASAEEESSTLRKLTV